MVDRKLLEISFNKDVPKEVTAASKAHLQNLQAIDKADQKMQAAKAEKQKATAAAEESDRALADALARWTPTEAAAAAK